MEMTPQTAWLIGILAVVLVGVAAFFIGRSTGGGGQARIDELEAELEARRQDMEAALSGKQQEMDTYRKDVETHFDRTATLFVSMAGSYKGLFEHLSEGYEKLSTGSARELFQQRVDALLIGNAKSADDAESGKLLAASAAAAAATAAAEAVSEAAEAASEASVPVVATEAVAASEAPLVPAVEAPPVPADAEASAAPAAAELVPGTEAPAAATPLAVETSQPPASVEADALARQAEGEGFGFDNAEDTAAEAGKADKV